MLIPLAAIHFSIASLVGRSSTTQPGPPGTGRADPRKKDIAMQLVSSAENSSLDWRSQYKYIEDIGDGRGYTAGIIGFCSGTGDMLDLVQEYTRRVPGNVLSKYLPALRRVNGTDSHAGLDPGFAADWRTAAADPQFTRAQDDERDRVYFLTPAVHVLHRVEPARSAAAPAEPGPLRAPPSPPLAARSFGP